jgi:hypothetical protein
MIVRPGDGVLHLVTQPDHAALAARLMAEWPPLAGASRRADILTAIEHHDRGWGESDAAPTVDAATGRIRDFIGAPIAIRQGVWPVSVRLLAGTPWAAALVAHHAVTVYGRFRADEAWQAFFPAMTALRDEYLARAGGELAVLEADYVHVRLGDLLSLVFCTGASQPEYFGPWTIRLHGTRLQVQPSALRMDVPFTVAACEIADVAYPDDVALQTAIAAGARRLLRGVVTLEPIA